MPSFYTFLIFQTISECVDDDLIDVELKKILCLVLFSCSNRGRLCSMSLLLRNFGTLLIFVLGATVDYHTIPCICITIPIIFAICFTLLPNTPQFYLNKGQYQVS